MTLPNICALVVTPGAMCILTFPWVRLLFLWVRGSGGGTDWQLSILSEIRIKRSVFMYLFIS